MPSVKKAAEMAAFGGHRVACNCGSVKVSEPLRLMVQDAIRKLNYHPNHVARSLKTSKTRTMGIIVPDMTISFFPHVIRGAGVGGLSLGGTAGVGAVGGDALGGSRHTAQGRSMAVRG
jgi:hypothetical protein